MGRNIGSRDLSARCRRSDIGKKRKFYAGKKVKPKRTRGGKFVPYKSKRDRDAPVKIWFQKKKEMSKVGYLKWSPKLRPKLDKTVKIFVGKPVRVDVTHISTPQDIGETAIQILQDIGTFNLMMLTHAKNTHRVSYKKKAVIKIEEGTQGLFARVTSYSKMSHYWFWRK